MGIIISAAVTAGLFGSYMVDYYIESAVFFGISLICLIYSFIQMKAAYLNEEKKKLKLEKKAAKKIHKLKSKVNKEPDFSDNEQPENSDIKDNE